VLLLAVLSRWGSPGHASLYRGGGALVTTMQSERIKNPFNKDETKNLFTGKSTEVLNDAFTRANRASRQAGATDRFVEILQPLGMSRMKTRRAMSL